MSTVFPGFTRVPVTEDPEPASPPVNPPVTTGAVQIYVVPAGTVPLVTLTGVTVKVPPLQITAVIGVTEGFGLIVTTIVNGVPVQVPDKGVTVYVAVWDEFVGLLIVPVIAGSPLPAMAPVMPPVITGADHE